MEIQDSQSTIAGLVKEALKRSGINISISKERSKRSMSTSKVDLCGPPIDEII